MINTRINISKMYGFNEWDENILFETDRKNNIIYGLNASGKSSFSKSLAQLLKTEKYGKILTFDEKEFFLNFKFDNLDINISEKKELSQEEKNMIKKRLFVFNKHYVRESYANIDGSEKVEIGINVKERQDLLVLNSKLISDYIKVVKKSLEDNFKFTKQGDFVKQSSFIGFFKNDEANRLSAIKKMMDLNLENNYEYDNSDLVKGAIEDTQKLMKLYGELTSEIVEELEEKIGGSEYKINSREDLDFYNIILRYLEYISDIDKCPVCKSEKFDCEYTKSEIRRTIDNYFSTKKISNIMEIINSVNSNSELVEFGLKIFDDILNKSYPTEKISCYIKKVKFLLDNYDSIIFSQLNLEKPVKLLDIIEINKNRVKVINDENEGTTTTEFTDLFNKHLNKFFEDDKLKVNAKGFEDKSGNKTLGINILINGKEKEGTSIKVFFDKILSESQKTKISLAFFISIVLNKSERDKKILCVFDDPVDSYDSISKHNIARILYEFMYKKVDFQTENYDSNTIILTHNYEFLRIFLENTRRNEKMKDFNYFCMTLDSLKQIDTEHLFVLNGDFNILKDRIGFNKNNVTGKVVKMKEFLSFMPILRELTNYSEKVLRKERSELMLNQFSIKDLNNYLSNSVVHGFQVNKKFNELMFEVEKYIDIRISDISNFNGDEFIYKIIESIIEHDKNYILSRSLNFYDEIVLKNLLSIYIRGYYDNYLLQLIKNVVPSFNGKEDFEIQDKKRTIGDKISVLYKQNKNTPFSEFSKVVEISQKRVLYNDFAHSAGLYMTPLIDIKIEMLFEEYRMIEKGGVE